MRITDLNDAIVGNAPVVRITTDDGLVGYRSCWLSPLACFSSGAVAG